MRETVCIVLNEREAQKARAADMLQNALSELAITSSRLEVCEEINELIKERLPQILVLDYLLGDYSTGLDVLNALASLPEDKRPSVFFLTDEPSVQVAVEAMRLGACNYFEIDNPQSISRLAREIQQILRERRVHSSRVLPRPRSLSLKDLVAQAESSRNMIIQARTLLLKCPSVIIVHGPAGSGRSTIAQALLAGRRAGFSRIIDLATCAEPLSDMLGLNPSNSGPKLGLDLSVLIENLEADTGELADLIFSRANRIWRASIGSSSSLILCSTAPEITQAWKSLVKECEVLRVPPLGERTEDIPALVQKFIEEACDISGQKLARFDGELISWLATLDWPGQVRELKAVVLNAALASAFSAEPKKQIISLYKDLWESEIKQQKAAPPLSVLTAASVLEMCGHNYRMAAARLGCSPQALLKLLYPNSPQV